MYSSQDLIKIAIESLKKSNIENVNFEAEILLSYILNIPKEYLLIKEYRINQELSAKFLNLIQKRKNHYPLQYIIGEWEFWSFKIYVSEGVFIPRPETETLIELCIETIPKDIQYFIDIGTGSGNIAIALAKEFPCNKIIAIDISDKALNLAYKNIFKNSCNNKIELLQADLLNSINSKSLSPPVAIISNPPYISEQEVDFLPEEIKKYEPKISYLAKNNGLQYYFNIIKQLNEWKINPIYLIFEITPNLLEKIIKFAKKYHFQYIKVKKDLLNKDRALLLKRS